METLNRTSILPDNGFDLFKPLERRDSSLAAASEKKACIWLDSRSSSALERQDQTMAADYGASTQHLHWEGGRFHAQDEDEDENGATDEAQSILLPRLSHLNYYIQQRRD